MAPSALLDTCVLYPSHLRDTLLRLAEAGLFRALWSQDILTELHRNLSEIGIAEAAITRLVGAMTAHFSDAQVIGYTDLIDAMTCDPKDRHVLAAAVHTHADFLVTFNIRDFPPTALSPYLVELNIPDDFLLDLLDLAPRVVIDTLNEQAASHKREPKTLRRSKPVPWLRQVL